MSHKNQPEVFVHDIGTVGEALSLIRGESAGGAAPSDAGRPRNRRIGTIDDLGTDAGRPKNRAIGTVILPGVVASAHGHKLVGRDAMIHKMHNPNPEEVQASAADSVLVDGPVTLPNGQKLVGRDAMIHKINTGVAAPQATTARDGGSVDPVVRRGGAKLDKAELMARRNRGE
jgi:fructose-specific component phosphotransferase system IIB-like protein